MTHLTTLGVQLGIYGYGPFGRQPEKDLSGVLGVVRATGYDGAEIMTNLLPHGSQVIRQAFENAGLSVAALHIFAEDMVGDSQLESLLDAMNDFSCPRLIVSSAVDGNVDTYRALGNRLNEAGVCGNERGLAVYYHPHDAEYRLLGDGSGRRGVDLLAEETEQDLVAFNIDTYWAYRGGADPVEVIRQFADRCDYYHVKDGDDDENCPLGHGQVGIDACLEAVKRADRRPSWMVYEDAHPKLPPQELCKIARDCIIRYGFGC